MFSEQEYLETLPFISERYVFYYGSDSREVLKVISLFALAYKAKLINLDEVKSIVWNQKDITSQMSRNDDSIFWLVSVLEDKKKSFRTLIINSWKYIYDEDGRKSVYSMVSCDKMISITKGNLEIIEVNREHSLTLKSSEEINQDIFDIYFKPNSAGRLLDIKVGRSISQQVVDKSPDRDKTSESKYKIRHDDGRVITGNTYQELANQAGDISRRSVGKLFTENRKIKGWECVV